MNLLENNFTKKIIGVLKVLKVSFVALCHITNHPSIKRFFRNNISKLIVLISAVFISTNVFSAAGDFISTTATIDYDVGGATNTAVASVVFTEDRKINFTVIDSNGGAVVPVISAMNDAVMQFTVNNLGNSTQDFLLTALNTSPNPFGIPTDNFDALSLQVFVESGLTPGYQLAEDTAVYIDELSPTAAQIVYLVTDLPVLVDDAVSVVALIAQVAEGGSSTNQGAVINADDNARVSPAGTFSNGSTVTVIGSSITVPDQPSSMQTVFNDPAGLAPEDISTSLPATQDIAGNGQHSDTGVFQVSSPVLITKSVTVIDTIGGSDPHPGAILRYQLDVTVAGNTAVDKLVISDLIPDNTTYTDGSILLNGVTQTDADDIVTVDYSRANNFPTKPIVSIEVDLSENNSVAVAPGVTNTIIFEVTIN